MLEELKMETCTCFDMLFGEGRGGEGGGGGGFKWLLCFQMGSEFYEAGNINSPLPPPPPPQKKKKKKRKEKKKTRRVPPLSPHG